MKLNKITILGAIAALTLITSCKTDYLDTEPTTSVGEGLVFSDAENLMAAVNGMHRRVNTGRYYGQGTWGLPAMMIHIDVMGDDLVFPNNGNGWYVSESRWNGVISETSDQVYFFWELWYQIIKNANNIIVNGSNAAGDANLRDKAIGEAYAYRAYAYFTLVQAYGGRYMPGTTNNQPGVVIRTDAGDYDPKARASVEEVYSQIWEDLDKAEQLLKGKTKGNTSHFNYNTVKGIQARVALTQGLWQKAADAAVLARQGYTLMDNATYKSGFNSSSNSEWIWGTVSIDEQAESFAMLHSYLGRNALSSNVRDCPKVLNIDLYHSFPTSDVRVQVVSPDGEHPSLALASTMKKFNYTSQKFFIKNPNSSVAADTPYMRAAEMYLIEAEALAKAGKESESKAVFAILEKNRNPSYVDGGETGQAYIDKILLSRRLELWGEGFRFYDLKRLNVPLKRSETAGFNAATINYVYDMPRESNRWNWLIPRQEIQSNPLVEQNPL